MGGGTKREVQFEGDEHDNNITRHKDVQLKLLETSM